MNSTVLINKPLIFLEDMVLIFWFKSNQIFYSSAGTLQVSEYVADKWEQIYQCILLKAKQQKAIQLP